MIDLNKLYTNDQELIEINNTYEFNIEYDDYLEEIYQNNQNKLDIFAFLWENIELEVPIRYTESEEKE